ncbi:MAG: RsmD family RNA methyltransferase [Polyangiaceae bacterium]
MSRFGCPHAACPGCALIDVPIEEQRATKERRLRDALHAYPELEHVRVEACAGVEPVTGYRTRAKWAVDAQGDGDAPIRIGLYRDGASHVVEDIPGCVVAAPAIVEVGAALRHLSLDASARAVLSAVDLREVQTDAGARVFVTLVLTDRAALPAATAAARRLLSASPRVVGVFANLRDASAPQMLGPSTVLLAGAESALDRVGSARVFATPGSFVQAHRGGAALLEERLVAFVSGLGIHAPRVLELFAGSGAFGLALAARGARVTAVESFAPAARSIGDAAARAGLPVEVARADAEAFLARAPEAFDLIVVDPPRRGLTRALRHAIAEREPRAIAYVSCDPDTLARDLAHLATLGYRAESATPVDMIPLTHHVEAITLLSRGVPAPPPPPKRPGDVVVFDADVSGARVDDLDAVRARAAVEVELTCFVTGVARAKGKILAWSGGVATYGRTGVHSGHSELAIRVTGTAPVRLGPILDRLAKFGHAPLGDAKRGTAAGLRHAFESLGLDRAYVHVLSVTVTKDGADPIRTESPLAGDLVSVRRRLVGDDRRGVPTLEDASR